MARADPLKQYKAKRDFSVTSEPEQGGTANENVPVFVIQKHWARRLHYDFRLELDGTMKSWAVPKGPSLDPADKRMAVHVEDHPISYNRFEGQIPKGEYGAGKVIIWDQGTWAPEQDPRKAYRAGKLKFSLHGQKLQGRWALIRMRGNAEKQEPWLLIKEKDEFARPAATFDVVEELPDSVGAAATSESAHARARVGKAARAPLPAMLKPQLATLTDKLPGEPQNWLFEIKYDGYRLLARIDGRRIQLVTRNGHNWTQRMPHLVQAMKKMKLPAGWYDGEIVVMNDQGLPDFQALQNAFDSAHTDSIRYYLFDMPYSRGMDLRELPLTERRARLEQLLHVAVWGADCPVQFSAAFDAPLRDIQSSACKMGLEGLIAKRKDSLYSSSRSAAWLKLKCGQRQEFVIGGYTEPQGAREGIGALLLGVHDEDGALRYAGKVGTGFSIRTLQDIHHQLDALQTSKSPFVHGTPTEKRAQWVQPKLLAEVSFSQWTSSGRIRHSVFHGLRSDKAALSITRETSMTTIPKQVKVTHPDRIVDPSTGTRKIDVVEYYARIAPLMMPHLKGRPVSLVRAPDGVQGKLFFQKHLEAAKMNGVRDLPTKLDPGHEPLLEIATDVGLMSAAQMNTLEFHTWNTLKTLIDKPDRMTFDLDPGKGVDWTAMQEAAMLLHAFLQELELLAFIKTSGGKGLHVVVPLKRRHDWDTVKGFSQAVVQHLAKTLPKRFAAKSGPRNRVGKIFIDYLRNGRGATTVSAWSLRARPGMGVSVPVSWDEVEKLTSATHWNMGNIQERLDVGNTPWVDYADSATTLTRAMKILKY